MVDFGVEALRIENLALAATSIEFKGLCFLSLL